MVERSSSGFEELHEVPKYHEFMWPTLQALKELGNSGAIQEINDKAAEIMHLSDRQLSVLHGDGPATKVAYRMGWARTYLKYGGAITNTDRGIWTVTRRGMEMSYDEVTQIPSIVRAMFASRNTRERETELRKSTTPIERESADEDPDLGQTGRRSYVSTDPEVWKDALLETLLVLEPDQFERLCQRLLREAGFTRVKVTGRRGDGGIDGVGVLRVALLSFHVFFQCKRYKGSVGASAIRDFRGAMVGRTDKGLFITTGTFTPDAVKEATRDGAPALDLIDGEAITDLIKNHKLGVATRQVEEVTVDPQWFADL